MPGAWIALAVSAYSAILSFVIILWKTDLQACCEKIQARMELQQINQAK